MTANSSDRRRKRAIFTAVLLVTLAALLVYGTFDPAGSIFFPKCIFHSITGLDCPGCGTQRALHRLLGGDICEALRYNALAVFAIPYIAGGIALSFIETGSNPALDKIRGMLYSGKAAYFILAAVLAFWILRNLVPRA